MTSARPSVTETGHREYDVVNASTTLHVAVPEPGVYQVSTLRGQQAVVGHGVYAVNARVRLLYKQNPYVHTETLVEQMSASFRFGDQREPIPAEAVDALRERVVGIVHQASAEVESGWQYVLPARDDRTAAQLRAQLELALKDVAHAEDRANRVAQQLVDARSRHAAALASVQHYRALADEAATLLAEVGADE